MRETGSPWKHLRWLVVLALGAVIAAGACRREAPGTTARTKPARPAPNGEDAAPVSFPRADAALAALDRELARHQAAVAAAQVNPARAEPSAIGAWLAAMVQLDQFIRTFAPPRELSGLALFYFNRHAGTRYEEIDRTNTQAVRAIIDLHGWPPISAFGDRAASDLWLLVQHADHDVAFQKQALGLMEPLVARGEASPSNFAYLWDRVASNEGRPQRYGTQGQCIGPAWEPLPLEDPDQVDQRRVTVELGPLSEYRDLMADICRR